MLLGLFTSLSKCYNFDTELVSHILLPGSNEVKLWIVRRTFYNFVILLFQSF